MRPSGRGASWRLSNDAANPEDEVRYWLNRKVTEVQDGREDAIHIGTQK